MKRISLIILCSVLIITACGADAKEEHSDSKDTQLENIETENDKNQELEISMETLVSATENPQDEFSYVITENGVRINEYIGKSAMVVIPEKIDGIEVVEIGLSAFMNNEFVAAVKIANSVKDMSGYGIFMNCINLQYIILGDNVEEIGDNCISGCKKLEEIKLNNKLKKIGEFGLYTGSDKLKEIHIPESVVEMDEAAVNDFSVIYVKAGSYAEEYMKSYNTLHDYIVE